MGEQTLELVKKLNEHDKVLMQIIDMCNTKKEYKKLVKFCKDQKKLYKEALKLNPEDYAINAIRSLKINENTDVTSVIRNFDPGSYNIRDKFPAEIQVSIGADVNSALTTRGSAVLGGCNEAEYNEFLTLLNSGVSDFRYIKENKESEEDAGET